MLIQVSGYVCEDYHIFLKYNTELKITVVKVLGRYNNLHQ